MLRGMCTVSFFVADMAAATRWYAELFGVEPYFERSTPDGTPAYTEFRIGDYQGEFGLLNARFAPHEVGQAAGAIVYWHVDDIEKSLARVLAHGATLNEPVTERGPGFVTASVVDPFGNVLGLMFNQHYLDVLENR
ncbi:VOC family protein [Pseudonocardia sp. TRM90224]|uniref:VOC family protein n=1 Tax=Pseudonocardia sp. TRM90224 TaxID=2812678 RepID=UPI001E561B83|nr:VOC family protein [Pseudonocardia sp. TRM90224]